MVQFNSVCLYQLVCHLDSLLEVFQGLYEGRCDIYKLVENLCVYNVNCVHKEKFKNSKKLLHFDLSFFITNVLMSAHLAISGLQQSNRHHIPDWLGSFCVLYMLSLYKYRCFQFRSVISGSFLPGSRRTLVIYPHFGALIEIIDVFCLSSLK